METAKAVVEGPQEAPQAAPPRRGAPTCWIQFACCSSSTLACPRSSMLPSWRAAPGAADPVAPADCWRPQPAPPAERAWEHHDRAAWRDSRRNPGDARLRRLLAHCACCAPGPDNRQAARRRATPRSPPNASPSLSRSGVSGYDAADHVADGVRAAPSRRHAISVCFSVADGHPVRTEVEEGHIIVNFTQTV